MDKVVVRDAVLEDAAAMGRVHVRSWQAAYADIMPQGLLDDLDQEERAGSWREAMKQSPVLPTARRLVVEVDGNVAGLALVRRDRAAEDSVLGELALLYLGPEVWGQGVGSKLLAACIGSLIDLGYDEAILWVASENRRGRRFYEREGWSLDGGNKVEVLEGIEVSEVRYRRFLSPD